MAMSYSPSGNILSKQVNALTLLAGSQQVQVDYDASYNYSATQPHTITTINSPNGDQSFEWDANGNMVSTIALMKRAGIFTAPCVGTKRTV
jgi:YD repeat-containing protein